MPVADCPKAIGAAFAETGCFFANAMSSRSILRCSCGMGRLGCVIRGFFHGPQGLHSGTSVLNLRSENCRQNVGIATVYSVVSTNSGTPVESLQDAVLKGLAGKLLAGHTES